MLLEEGLTKVTVSLPDGRAALLALRVGGDLVGEVSALNDRPRSASVTTCGPAITGSSSPAGSRRSSRSTPTPRWSWRRWCPTGCAGPTGDASTSPRTR
ncbi:cyclic nucleotide-binding domain-containing protein [Micromonospora sp. NPDC047812]|uniref:cyclic nucleotide-binding domain-containing protein n=1 Tax=Micromonospora sp. NPDC047812 TaxID=3155742 RepID=UPI0034522545